MINILADGDANTGYLIGAIVALCLLIVLIAINIIYTIKVNRVIARNEVGITSEVHISPEDYKAEHAVVKVVISNHNFRTINIIAFGIYYDKKLYDYIGKYAQETEVSIENSTKKVYINSSDSIVITLSIDEIEKIVNQTKNLKRILIMAQDSAGRVTKKSARTIREFIKKLRKQRKMDAKTVNVDSETFEEKKEEVKSDEPEIKIERREEPVHNDHQEEMVEENVQDYQEENHDEVHEDSNSKDDYSDEF